MWDTALLLSRFSFCIYIHRTARFTGSERKRGEAAQLTRILLPLILLEGFPAKADGGQSEAEQDLPPSASEIAFQPQSPVAPLEGRVMQSPRKGRLAPTEGRTRPLHPHKAAAADLGPPRLTRWSRSPAGARHRHPHPEPPAPLRAAGPSPTEPLLVFQKPFPNTATPQPPPPPGLGKRLRRGGGEGPRPEPPAGPRWGRSGGGGPPCLRYRHRSSSASPSSAPSHHCGSADGSSVTSLFLPPCFDPAVLIVQANPTLPALAACQDCY